MFLFCQWSPVRDPADISGSDLRISSWAAFQCNFQPNSRPCQIVPFPWWVQIFGPRVSQLHPGSGALRRLRDPLSPARVKHKSCCKWVHMSNVCQRVWPISLQNVISFKSSQQHTFFCQKPADGAEIVEGISSALQSWDEILLYSASRGIGLCARAVLTSALPTAILKQVSEKLGYALHLLWYPHPCALNHSTGFWRVLSKVLAS